MRKSRKQPRSYARVKWLAAVFMVMLGLVMAWGCLKPASSVTNVPGEGGRKPDDVNYVLLLGVDRRADDVGRSDTLMVAAVDMNKEKAALLSVPRDTRVEIEGHGFDKINHAYAFGGHKLTQQTVEELLGTRMDHYIIIDTKSFERLIDAIDGVDINVEKRMYYEDPWDDNGGLVIDLYPGEQHLDGRKAIQYVRYRDGEGDIGRIGRQQKFMQAVLAKLISPEILPRLPQLVQEASSVMETDMSVAELLEFANLMKNVHASGLTAQMVPGQPAFLDEVSYWIPDITDVRALLPEALGLTVSEEDAAADQEAEDKYLAELPAGLSLGEKNTGTSAAADRKQQKEDHAKPMRPEEISVLVINESGINGAGAEVARVLAGKGFIISSVETGKTSSREQTTITTSTRNTDVFYGMPFPCLIMDGGSSNQAVVRIGLDYRR